MSRLKSYILNEGRSITIDKDKALKIIETKCSRAYSMWKKNGPEDGYIFRSISGNTNPYLMIDSRGTERRSRNTTNYYTLLFNHILKSWKRYPTRNIICETVAAVHGFLENTYHVFPIDGTEIGVCPNADIWDSFEFAIDELNGFLRRTFEVLKMDVSDNNPDSLKKAIISIDQDDIEYVKQKTRPGPGYAYIHVSHITEEMNIKTNLYEWLDDKLDPEGAGFKLVRSGDRLPSDEREVWFDSKAVLINLSENIE